MVAQFARLVVDIEDAKSSMVKEEILFRYYSTVNVSDRAWAVYFLLGRRFKGVLSKEQLVDWAQSVVELPDWLMAESLKVCGDYAEAVAILLSEPFGEPSNQLNLAEWIENVVLPARLLSPSHVRDHCLSVWKSLSTNERWLYNRLLLGNFRLSVSRDCLIGALSRVYDLPRSILSHRLIAEWNPTPERFDALVLGDSADGDVNRIYESRSFQRIDSLQLTSSPINSWRFEYGSKGKRIQIVRRANGLTFWDGDTCLDPSTLGELVTALAELPIDTAIEGYFSTPVADLAIQFTPLDVFEFAGRSFQTEDLSERLQILERIVEMAMKDGLLGSEVVKLQRLIQVDNWDGLRQIHQDLRREGYPSILMRRLSGSFQDAGEHWLEWRAEVHRIYCVLLYVNRQASEYTFGVRNGDEFVSVVKLVPILNPEETAEMGEFIQRNTLERFGPVRTVKAEKVVEIEFEGAIPSKRHKAGFVLNAPRISRWMHDLGPADIGTFDEIKRTCGLI